MNDHLTELYRSCRPKEALASQDEFKSANVLLGSEVEKFAELIVRECQTVVEWAISVDSTIDRVPMLIKEHFGVEE